MLFIILSVLDLIAGLLMVIGTFGYVSLLLAMAGGYLMLKLAYWRDPFTIVDFLAGVYCIFVYFGHSGILTLVFAAYFVYKFATGSLAQLS